MNSSNTMEDSNKKKGGIFFKKGRPTKKHDCALNIGSDSMLPKKNKRNLCRTIRKLTLIAVHHPNTDEHFISYPAIVAERQRQLGEGGAWVIHPYSLTSLIWRTFMILINLIYVMAAPMRLCYILPKPNPEHCLLDYVIFYLKPVILADIFVNFNMGYRNKHEKYIVMDRKRIALHYLTRWFLIDLVSVMPVGFMVAFTNVSFRAQMFMRLVACVRCLKLVPIVVDFKIFMRIFNFAFILRRLARLGLLFGISLHWCSCLIYLAPAIKQYWTGQIPEGYCRFLPKSDDLTNLSIHYRYKKAVYISCAAFFGTAFSTFRAKNPDEMVTNAIVIVWGQIFMLFTMGYFLKIYMTEFRSTLKYQELMNQVEKYMQNKQFPAQMRNRVREFYRYRYHEKYFKENVALDCLSERLRNEIALDTCHKLIEKVPLFEGLPASVVGTVLGCLHAEVYLPNDMVARAGDIGDCMYFIACGTVAVYTMKGAEVCHLDDGCHFGEVALLMKDRKRVATVIAIEITEVYRLDQVDFRDFIMTYKELYERVEALASKRMHETVLIDEAYKIRRHTL